MINEIFSFLTMKKFCNILFITIAAFLIPVKPLILTVGVCIFIDTIMGIYRAKKQKKAITSRALSQVVTKMVLYQGALILFFVIEKYMLTDFVTYFVNINMFITKIVAAVLCGIEILSIEENIKLATGVDYIEKVKNVFRRSKSLKDMVVGVVDSDDKYEDPIG